MNESPIVLFDGICNLCNQSVKFILKYEKNEFFKFATLQSKAAQEKLIPFQHEKITDSVLLIEKGKLYQQSTAALRIVKKLKYFWWIYYLIYLPKWMRDPFYQWIARNRYRWFGTRKSCMVPNEHLKNRFL